MTTMLIEVYDMFAPAESKGFIKMRCYYCRHIQFKRIHTHSEKLSLGYSNYAFESTPFIPIIVTTSFKSYMSSNVQSCETFCVFEFQRLSVDLSFCWQFPYLKNWSYFVRTI
ncbi:uncharacterized protein EV154DRAFT_483316 [Mucor mucedo]|uniref:uncharacterized protein n=1 Tax=Mucor mucedo TaxID=29922 RepID=UPI00221EB9B3|nr:uncharacterized protein EV154DRAFT_483316 [Mucor mucedo]KAI7889310.1 hypothetical protein EV154DRAFT_483316 [Mucor mucedo]